MKRHILVGLALLGLTVSSAHALTFNWLEVDQTEVTAYERIQSASGGMVTHSEDWTGNGSELPFSRSHELLVGAARAWAGGSADADGASSRVEISGAEWNRRSAATSWGHVQRKFRIDGDPGTVWVDFTVNSLVEWDLQTEDGYAEESLFELWGFEMGIPDWTPPAQPSFRPGNTSRNRSDSGSLGLTGTMHILLETNRDYHWLSGCMASITAPEAGNGIGGAYEGWVSHRIGLPTVEFSDPTQPVPEPGSFALLGIGLMGLSVSAIRRRRGARRAVRV